MGNGTEPWDDSGTAPGVASSPSSTESSLFVLDETVDNVGIAMRSLAAGDIVSYGGTSLNVRTAVPDRHKIALVDIDAGDTIRKLGHTIGIATTRIVAGAHSHGHNPAVPPVQPAAASGPQPAKGALGPGGVGVPTVLAGHVRTS